MADSASELESDTSSIDGGPTNRPSLQLQVEQLQKRLESLQQENRVLRMELDTFKLKCKTLEEQNKDLRRASVTIVSRHTHMHFSWLWCSIAVFKLLPMKLTIFFLLNKVDYTLFSVVIFHDNIKNR